MGPVPLVVLVPVLARPHRVEPLLKSIHAATPECRVLFIASPGDTGEIWALDHAGADYMEVDGNYAEKINAGAAATTEPLIFLGADDLHFHEGWLGAARAKMVGRIGVVGTQDMCNPQVIAGKHATHFLITRWYAEWGTIDEPGKVLHEGYLHEYVDNEFIETAKKREAYAFANDSVVEHLHPMVGKADMDDLYAGMAPRMRHGRRVFMRRRALWA